MKNLTPKATLKTVFEMRQLQNCITFLKLRKMKKRHLIFGVSFLMTVTILFFNSCTKEESDIIDESTIADGYNSKGVKVIDNVVYFKNNDAFTATMNELHEKGRENLEFWEKENAFTNSYRKVLDDEADMVSAKEDLAEDLIIEDPFFAAVVNKDGVFVIENTIHKITYDTEYLISGLNFSKLAEIKEGNNSKSTSGVTSHPIKRKEFSSPDGAKGVSGTKTRKKNTTSNPPVCRNDISAHLQAWSVNYLAYASAGIRIKGRKLKNGNWKNDKMWYAKVDGCAEGFANNQGPFFECGSKSKENKKRVEKVLIMTIPGTINTDRIECTYTYEDDGCPRISWTEVWD